MRFLTNYRREIHKIYTSERVIKAKHFNIQTILLSDYSNNCIVRLETITIETSFVTSRYTLPQRNIFDLPASIAVYSGVKEVENPRCEIPMYSYTADACRMRDWSCAGDCVVSSSSAGSARVGRGALN